MSQTLAQHWNLRFRPKCFEFSPLNPHFHCNSLGNLLPVQKSEEALQQRSTHATCIVADNVGCSYAR